MAEVFGFIYLAVFVVGAVIRVVGVSQSGQSREQQREAFRSAPALEKTLLLLHPVATQLLPLLFVFSGWLAFADYALPNWLNWAGVLTGVGFWWLLWRSHADLGQNWRVAPEGEQAQTLVESGVYRYIRHPMYSAHILWALAQALLLHNWLAGLAGLVITLPMMWVRVPREEEKMLAQFGDDYRDYMTRTGGIVPKLW